MAHPIKIRATDAKGADTLGSEASAANVAVLQEPEIINPSAPDLQINPADVRIDVGAKFALQRMIKDPGMAQDAARIIRGINGGTLAGVYGDDLYAAVKVAHAHGMERWQLVPKGEDAAFVLDAAAPLQGLPTIIFRGDTPDIRQTPRRIDPALQKASRTFELLQKGKLAPCDVTGTTVPVPNLVPATFGQVAAQDLTVMVTAKGSDPMHPGAPIFGAQVDIQGPLPSTERMNAVTDPTGTAILRGLPSGSYEITVKKEKFKDASRRIIHPDDPIQMRALAAGSVGLPNSVLFQLRRQLLVQKYNPAVDDPSPEFGFQSVSSGTSAIIQVLAGSHAAVSVDNVSGSIRSNNPNVISNQDIFVVPRSANRSDVFFYCKPLASHVNPDTTLIELATSSGPHPLVQVRDHEIVSTVPLHGQHIAKNSYIKLYGHSMLLIGPLVTNCYRFLNWEQVTGNEKPADVIQRVVRHVQNKGRLNHLVINCHGTWSALAGGFIDLGQGFTDNNLAEWTPLRGLVDYIWIMNCLAGADDLLCAGIARNTDAWVTAWAAATPMCPWGALPQDHLDYYHQHPECKHWYRNRPGDNRPAAKDNFFRSARHSRSGRFRADLHFNVVRAPRMSYP